MNSHKLDLSDTASGLPFASQGRFVLVGREVNTTTGTIQFATEFHNRGSLLRPGGFGRVRICSGRYIEKHKRFAGRTNLAVPAHCLLGKDGRFALAEVGYSIGTDAPIKPEPVPKSIGASCPSADRN